MKKLSFLFLAFFLVAAAEAQVNPVSWTFSSKKIDDKTYELHMTASIQDGWHLYSQVQPEDAIAIPTGFKINNNPLVQLDGKVKEIGKMEKFQFFLKPEKRIGTEGWGIEITVEVSCIRIYSSTQPASLLSTPYFLLT